MINAKCGYQPGDTYQDTKGDFYIIEKVVPKGKIFLNVRDVANNWSKMSGSPEVIKKLLSKMVPR